MKRFLFALATLTFLSLPGSALADTLVFNAPVTAGNTNSTTSNPNNSNYQAAPTNLIWIITARTRGGSME